VRGEENFEVNVRVSVIHKDQNQHALRFVDSGVYVDGVALRIYARTRCLFVNVREWRGGVVCDRTCARHTDQRSKPLKLGVPDDSGLRP
jgi:hypothetical protein